MRLCVPQKKGVDAIKVEMTIATVLGGLGLLVLILFGGLIVRFYLGRRRASRAWLDAQYPKLKGLGAQSTKRMWKPTSHIYSDDTQRWWHSPPTIVAIGVSRHSARHSARHITIFWSARR